MSPVRLRSLMVTPWGAGEPSTGPVIPGPDPLPPGNPIPPVANAARPWGRLFDYAGTLKDWYPGIPDAEVPHGLQQPRTYLDTTPPVYAGAQATPFAVATESEFVEALQDADAQGGGILDLAAGFEAHWAFGGNPNTAWAAVFPPRTTTGYITIRSKPSTRPVGFPVPFTRISRAVRTGLPRFVGRDGNRALYIPSSTRNLIFEGVWLHHDDAEHLTALVRMNKAALNIWFRQTVWTASDDPETATRRGLEMAGSGIAVLDSHFSGFREEGTDSQAISVPYGRGPYKVVNTYLSAAGEPMLVGGNPMSDESGSFYVPSVSGDFYPKDFELRRNHHHRPQSLNVKHPRARDAAAVVRGPFTVTAADPFTGRYTITGGTFDTATHLNTNDWVRYAVKVTAGPGAGSWWEVDSYPSATTVDLRGTPSSPGGLFTNLHFGAPQVGSTIAVVRYKRWMAKNLFELKQSQYVLCAENVYENSWAGDDSQPAAVAWKTVNQTANQSGAPYHVLSDVILWDSVLMNVYEGFSITPLPQPPGIPAKRIVIDNALVIPGDHHWISPGNTLRRRVARIGVDDCTLSRITAPDYSHSWSAFERQTPAAAGAAPQLEHLTLERVLSVEGANGFRLDGALGGGIAAVIDLATFAAEGNGVIGPGDHDFPPGFTVSAVPPFVNPDRTALWAGADYSLVSGHPFASAPGGPAGVLYSQVMARTAGVRDPAVSMEWA